MVLVDKGWLAEVVDRLGEAWGAIARGNNRVAARNAYDRCVSAIYETGKAPADCPSPP